MNAKHDDIAAARALLAELAARREDARLAAGELLLPLPEPGSDLARVALANRLLAQENARLHAEVARLRAALAPATPPVEHERMSRAFVWRERLLAGRPVSVVTSDAQRAALARPLDRLDVRLYVRASNAVAACLAGVAAPLVAHAAALASYDLIRRKNFGRKSLRALDDALGEDDLSLDMAIDPEAFRAPEPPEPT